MTIEEMKVRAYDTLAQIEFLKTQLLQLNTEIARKSQEMEKLKENGTSTAG